MKHNLSQCLKNQQAVSEETAFTIWKLKNQLIREFGLDFSFCIMGNGHFVACSNYDPGCIDPKIKA